jgi:uncharacterized membrane protein YphA (DoxX/SURF4 family)
MDIAFLIGRILLGGYFVTAGINHFMHLNMMAGYAKMKGTPAPSLAVGGTGVLLLLGGLSLLLGVQTTIGVALLVIFLIGVSFKIHNYWAVPDPQMKMGERINFMKNIALAGALLMLMAVPAPWPLSLGR